MTEPLAPSPEPQYHTPGYRWPKILYLCLSTAVFLIGCWFVGEPLHALTFGRAVEARVAEIRMDQPGEPTRSIRFRRPYQDDSNYHAVYSHYVSVPVGDRFALFRISLDSRRLPIEFYNVNDRVAVAYLPDDPRKVAYAYKHVRTWGIGGMFFALGAAMLATAIPMLMAVGKPIRIDPENPEPEE